MPGPIPIPNPNGNAVEVSIACGHDLQNYSFEVGDLVSNSGEPHVMDLGDGARDIVPWLVRIPRSNLIPNPLRWMEVGNQKGLMPFEGRRFVNMAGHKTAAFEPFPIIRQTAPVGRFRYQVSIYIGQLPPQGGSPPPPVSIDATVTFGDGPPNTVPLSHTAGGPVWQERTFDVSFPRRETPHSASKRRRNRIPV